MMSTVERDEDEIRFCKTEEDIQEIGTRLLNELERLENKKKQGYDIYQEYEDLQYKFQVAKEVKMRIKRDNARIRERYPPQDSPSVVKLGKEKKEKTENVQIRKEKNINKTKPITTDEEKDFSDAKETENTETKSLFQNKTVSVDSSNASATKARSGHVCNQIPENYETKNIAPKSDFKFDKRNISRENDFVSSGDSSSELSDKKEKKKINMTPTAKVWEITYAIIWILAILSRFCDNNLINSRDFGDFLKQAFQYLEGFPMRIAVCCFDEKSSKHICDF